VNEMYICVCAQVISLRSAFMTENERERERVKRVKRERVKRVKREREREREGK
jgi:hypothetical protein